MLPLLGGRALQSLPGRHASQQLHVTTFASGSWSAHLAALRLQLLYPVLPLRSSRKRRVP
jgi:hypothetical protein